MSALKQLSTRISRFIVALEHARDPMIRVLGNRVDKLELDQGPS